MSLARRHVLEMPSSPLGAAYNERDVHFIIACRGANGQCPIDVTNAHEVSRVSRSSQVHKIQFTTECAHLGLNAVASFEDLNRINYSKSLIIRHTLNSCSMCDWLADTRRRPQIGCDRGLAD